MAALSDIIKRISVGSQAAKQTIEQGGSTEEARNAALNAFNIANTVNQFSPFFQQPQEPQQAYGPAAQSMAPGMQESSNGGTEEVEDSSFTKSRDDKKRQRSPWHQRMDEALGTEGLGGFANDMLSYSPVVSALDIMVPEFAFNGSQEDAYPQLTAMGSPREAVDNGDHIADPRIMAMPSGDQISMLTPEQREQWQENTLDGLVKAAFASTPALPIASAVGSTLTPILGKVASKAGKATEGVAKSAGEALSTAAETVGGAVDDAAKAAGNAASSVVKTAEGVVDDAAKKATDAASTAVKATGDAAEAAGETVSATSKWLEKALAESPEAVEEAVKEASTKLAPGTLERALSNIGKKVGKGPELNYGKAYDRVIAERFSKLPDEMKGRIGEAAEKAVEKNRGAGKTPLGQDYRDAMNILEKAKKTEASMPKYILGLSELATGLGLGGVLAAESTGVIPMGDGVPKDEGKTTGKDGGGDSGKFMRAAINGINTVLDKAKETGSVPDETLDGIMTSITGSNQIVGNGADFDSFAPGASQGVQYSEFWKTDAGRALLDELVGAGYAEDYLTGTNGYYNFLSSMDKDLAYRLINAIPTWDARYSAAGVDINDPESIYNYMWLTNPLLASEILGNPAYDFGSHGLDGEDVGNLILPYIFEGQNFASSGGLNSKDAAQAVWTMGGINGTLPLNKDIWNALSGAAGEGYMIGFADEDSSLDTKSHRDNPRARYQSYDELEPYLVDSGNKPVADPLFDTRAIDSYVNALEKQSGRTVGVKGRD